MDQPSTNGSIWGRVPIDPQPTLESDIRAKILVIGAGGSGLAAVDEALSLGEKDIVCIDAGRIASGAAGKNGGLLLAGLADPYHTVSKFIGRERARQAYDMTEREIDRMLVETHDCVRRTGSLRIETTPPLLDDCRAHMQALIDDGFHVDRYEGPEGTGLLLPNDAVFHPVEHCKQKVAQVLQGGAMLFEHTKAREIESGRVVTSGGTIHCEHIIAAVDGKLDLLFPELKEEITPYRLQMAATEQAPLRFRRPIYWNDGYNYLQQLEDGSFAVGGGRDEHGAAEITHCDDTTEPVQDHIRGLLSELGIDQEITHRWAAVVSYTKNGLPIAREVRHKVIALGAYCGTGNVMGRILGRAAVHASLRRDFSTIDLFTKDPSS